MTLDTFRKSSIMLLAIVLVLGASGALHAAQQRFEVPVLDSPYIGPSDAPVTIIEFIDYQ